jgi:hypothetical protein
MTGRRERITITAHGATDGAPDVTVEGALQTFRMDVQRTYGLSMKQLDTWNTEFKVTKGEVESVTLTLVLTLDPESARAWQSRGKRPAPAKLLTLVDPQVPGHAMRYQRARRVLDCIAAGASPSVLMLLTGRIPHTHQLAWPPR